MIYLLVYIFIRRRLGRSHADGITGQAFFCHHGFQHLNVGVNIQSVEFVEFVQLPLKALDDVVHDFLDSRFCLPQILAVNTGRLKLSVRIQQLLRGREIIIQEGVYLLFLFRVIFYKHGKSLL